MLFSDENIPTERPPPVGEVSRSKEMQKFGKFVWRKSCELYASLAHVDRRIKLEKCVLCEALKVRGGGG